MQTVRVQSLSSIEKNQIEGLMWPIKVVIPTGPDPEAAACLDPRMDLVWRSATDPKLMDGRGRSGLFNSGRRGGRTLELAYKMGRAGQAEESKRCGLNCKSGSLLG